MKHEGLLWDRWGIHRMLRPVLKWRTTTGPVPYISLLAPGTRGIADAGCFCLFAWHSQTCRLKKSNHGHVATFLWRSQLSRVVGGHRSERNCQPKGSQEGSSRPASSCAVWGMSCTSSLWRSCCEARHRSGKCSGRCFCTWSIWRRRATKPPFADSNEGSLLVRGREYEMEGPL